MKTGKIINTIAAFALLAGSLVTLSSTVAAQKSNGGILDEKRPFDFADKYYGDHGVDPTQMIDRRSGFDRYSVFDYIDSDVFRGVRILETRTGYDEHGKQIFWVLYGHVDGSGFTRNQAGEEAIKAASNVPVYFFPSAKFRYQERQSALIDRSDDNPDKNPLSLGTAVEVEYTRKAYTKEGQRMLAELLGNNGKSLDGLPIIRTPSEIGALTRYELITQRVRSISQPGAAEFIIARTIGDPRFGAISPDAFLRFTGDGSKPIDAEAEFFQEFDCLQKSGRYCREK